MGVAIRPSRSLRFLRPFPLCWRLRGQTERSGCARPVLPSGNNLERRRIMEAARIRVLLVDDHQMLLDALRLCIPTHPALEVVGVATNSDDLLSAVKATSPDVVVLDVNLPGRGAFDAVADLRSEFPQVKVLFLSGFLTDVFIAQALRLRANGYLLKGMSVQALTDAIARVARGEMVCSPEVQERLVFDPKTGRYSVPNAGKLASLTARQLEVVRHLVGGDTIKDIAEKMHISGKSVDSHRHRIMNKLGLHDRVELTRLAIREGLILP
jgi:DNA-binding NarL/FixJ family response regulator